MKLLKNIYNKWLAPACVYTVLVCGVLLMIASLTESMLPAIRDTVFASIFAYCLFFSLTNLIFYIKKINIVIKFLIHFLMNTAAFTFIAGSVAENSTGTPKIYYGIVFIGLYAVIAVIAGIVSHFINKKTQTSESEYKNQF